MKTVKAGSGHVNLSIGKILNEILNEVVGNNKDAVQLNELKE